MTTADETLRYWRENRALEHSTPPGTRWPEGFDVHEVLREMIPEGRVLDFGCGDGRMTRAFEARRYIGVDVNPHAVQRCREMFRDRRFLLIDDLSEPLPEADTVLCYTVLLHVHDDDIDLCAHRLAAAARRIVVVEILGRKWRGNGLPPVFNREDTEYEAIFSRHGRLLQRSRPMAYNRYGGVDITFMDFY